MRFPRLEIVNRPTRRHGTAYGPFFSRDLAQRYEQELLGLFQIRRCTETLTPSPRTSRLYLWRDEPVFAAVPVRREPG